MFAWQNTYQVTDVEANEDAIKVSKGKPTSFQQDIDMHGFVRAQM